MKDYEGRRKSIGGSTVPENPAWTPSRFLGNWNHHAARYQFTISHTKPSCELLTKQQKQQLYGQIPLLHNRHSSLEELRSLPVVLECIMETPDITEPSLFDGDDVKVWGVQHLQDLVEDVDPESLPKVLGSPLGEDTFGPLQKNPKILDMCPPWSPELEDHNRVFIFPRDTKNSKATWNTTIFHKVTVWLEQSGGKNLSSRNEATERCVRENMKGLALFLKDHCSNEYHHGTPQKFNLLFKTRGLGCIFLIEAGHLTIRLLERNEYRMPKSKGSAAVIVNAAKKKVAAASGSNAKKRTRPDSPSDSSGARSSSPSSTEMIDASSSSPETGTSYAETSTPGSENSVATPMDATTTPAATNTAALVPDPRTPESPKKPAAVARAAANGDTDPEKNFLTTTPIKKRVNITKDTERAPVTPQQFLESVKEIFPELPPDDAKKIYNKFKSMGNLLDVRVLQKAVKWLFDEKYCPKEKMALTMHLFGRLFSSYRFLTYEQHDWHLAKLEQDKTKQFRNGFLENMLGCGAFAALGVIVGYPQDNGGGIKNDQYPFPTKKGNGYLEEGTIGELKPELRKENGVAPLCMLATMAFYACSDQCARISITKLTTKTLSVASFRAAVIATNAGVVNYTKWDHSGQTQASSKAPRTFPEFYFKFGIIPNLLGAKKKKANISKPGWTEAHHACFKVTTHLDELVRGGQLTISPDGGKYVRFNAPPFEGFGDYNLWIGDERPENYGPLPPFKAR